MIEEIVGVFIKSLASHGPEAVIGGVIVLYMIYQNYVYTRDMKEMITRNIESRDALTQAMKTLTETVEQRIRRRH